MSIWEKEYTLFILGYDLLQDKLNKIECDIAFRKCLVIWSEFSESEEYKNNNIGLYQAIQEYLKYNEKRINEIIGEKNEKV